jgi:hypothetical protein
MIVRAAILGAALIGGAAFAQTGPGISGINAVGPGTGEFRETATAWRARGADPKEWQQRRLDRLKAILAANPEAVDQLETMRDPQQRAAYIRKLDRQTP